MAGLRGDLGETGLNLDPDISGISEALNMIGFHLLENGVRHLEEPVEDYEVPVQ
uniref:Uncharacterized protein n=1 Tax=Amphimedon queenslandica TaxID=400682 RepID=A0A1X7T0C8_AMPQE